MRRALAGLAFLGGLAGCASAAPEPPVHLGRTIAVLPPNNRTGDPLVVTGAGLIDRYVRRAEEVTVADVLLSEARVQLQENGFDVTARSVVAGALGGHTPVSPAAAAELAAQGGLKALLLYVEIRRWEPDAPTHTAFVIVGLTTSLIDAATGEVLWQADRRAAPVPTPGEITVEAAYVTAARRVMAEMLARLRPDLPDGSKP
jgi:hypothetical protein